MRLGYEAGRQLHPKAGARGRVAISLSRGAKCPRAISPLTPPREVSVALTGMQASPLDRMELEVELELAGGTHRVALFRSTDLLVEIQPGARCRGRVLATGPAWAGHPSPGVTLPQGGRPAPPFLQGGAPAKADPSPGAAPIPPGPQPASAPHTARPAPGHAIPRALATPRPAIVRTVDLRFTPPIVIRSLLPVLADLPGLFHDRNLALLFAQLTRVSHAAVAGASLAEWGELTLRRLAGLAPVAELPKLCQALGSVASDVASVALDRVRARPVRDRDGWRLDFRFSGRLMVADRLDVPFQDVRLPHAIVPALHGDLARLLSASPLATATLRPGSLDRAELADSVAGLVAAFRGRLEGSGQLPEFALDCLLQDQSRLDLRAVMTTPVAMRARFEGRLQQRRAEVTIKGLEMTAGTSHARVDAEANVRLDGDDQPGPGALPLAEDTGLVGRFIAALRDGRLPSGLRFETSACLAHDSRLPGVELDAKAEHPDVKGGLDLHGTAADLAISGRATASGVVDADGMVHFEHDAEAAFSGAITVPRGSYLGDGKTHVDLAGTSLNLDCHLRSDGTSPVRLEAAGRAAVAAVLTRAVEPFPELGVDTGELRLELLGSSEFAARTQVRRIGDQLVEVDFAGSSSRTVLERAVGSLGECSLALPPSSRIELAAREGVISAAGQGQARFSIAWDLGGRSPVLRNGDRAVELLVPSLCRRVFEVELSPVGGLSALGQDGDLYDARFFNALLNPGADVDRLLAVLQNDEAMERLLAAAELFSPEVRDLADRARALAKRGHEALEAEGVRRPGDFLPGRTMARIVSRILVGSPDLEERVFPLVKQITDGAGLDIVATKSLLDDTVGDHLFGFEVDRVLRWFGRFLEPTDPIPPFEALELPPLEELPEHQARLAGLPSAREIYATMRARAPLPAAFARTLARVAPWLTLDQLEWIAARGRTDWPEDDLLRLSHVLDLKRRVRGIGESYGGPAFAPQALAIALFLGETLAVSETWAKRAAGSPGRDAGAELGAIPETLFGPEDVAVLMQAGLASVFHGRTEQLNQLLLLRHVLAQPADYLRAVLVELSGRSAHVLAGVLNALLNQRQDCMRRPIDLEAELSARLGVELPRLEDYLAGGRWARQSYFDALADASERILTSAEPYLALRSHLQIDRRPASAGYAPTPATRALEKSARRAIAAADQVATPAACPQGARDPALGRQARAAYERAFTACAALIEAAPEAFQLPWLKAFWGRNYEALVVLSVVRNVQEDVDDVRHWIAQWLDREAPSDEQELVDAVIDALYHDPADRAELKADPLVRLLVDPPPGKYDFTVVSAMGVITEGARGRELEETYRRLGDRRGVKVVRADTSTMRSLADNAVRIEEAIRSVRGPWGAIGYSQGCANFFYAEQQLLGGTPDQQALIAGLRARMLVCSAFNGSAHGTCSNLKYRLLVAEGERFLKHYQAVFSRPAIKFAQRAVRLLIDSRIFVLSMLGSDGLSHEGVRFLQREGQFRPDVPTSTMRAIVEPKIMPEALEWLSHVLSRQIESEDHDTQVAAHEAVGYPVWVRNQQAALLERCAMGDRIQRAHHWSPLVHETAFVTTPRDRERGIYELPKDRHVFPWIEVNARFGIIKPKKPNGARQPKARRKAG